MGEISINSAVELISSEQLKQRSEGLAGSHPLTAAMEHDPEANIL